MRTFFQIVSPLVCALVWFASPPLPCQAADPPAGYTVEEFSRMLWLPESDELNRYVPFHPSERRELIETALGQVVLRQPQNFSGTLGFSPRRTIEQAWNTAAEFLVRENFPEAVRQTPFGWNVILTDRGPVPLDRRVSSEYCHTAMMGPPADVVIDGFRLLHPCSPAAAPDAPRPRLLRSLVHEVGHGVEYRLLGTAFSRRQRWHSEGFASWFESRATGELSSLRAKSRLAFDPAWRPYFFSGSPKDYGMSSALVGVIAETGTPQDLLRVYTRMSADGCSFVDAVERELGWNFSDWMRRAEEYVIAPSEPVQASALVSAE